MVTLIPFLRGLQETGRHYTIGHYRRDAVTVHVTASAFERWEVEFLDDGSVEIERFVSTGRVEEAAPDALIAELQADT